MLFLDVTAGGRMIWKHKRHPDFVFMDKNPWSQIPPDVVGVWEHLPFRDDLFETLYLGYIMEQGSFSELRGDCVSSGAMTRSAFNESSV